MKMAEIFRAVDDAPSAAAAANVIAFNFAVKEPSIRDSLGRT